MADIKVRIIAEDKATDVLKQTGKAVDDAGKAAKEAGGAFEGMGKTMASIAGGMGLQMGLQAIVGTLKNVVVGSFELAAALETTKVGFTTMLGSGEAAQGMLDDLKAFADTTPFEFTDLTEAASKMVAMGTAAEDVIPMLTTVGDTAAGLGLGKAGIDRITLALMQMGAKGKIGGDDLRQLAEAGIPAMKYLADGAGVSTAEMAKLVEKGLVPAKEGVQTLLANMKQDFGGLMAKQADTASGKLSTMKDAMAGLGTEIGEVLVPKVKAGADALTIFFNVMKDVLAKSNNQAETIGKLDEALAKSLITQTEYNKAVFVASTDGSDKMYEDEAVAIELVETALRRAKERFTESRDEEVRYTRAMQDNSEEARNARQKTIDFAAALENTAEKQRLAKEETDKHKESLKLFADMSNLVSGAVKEYETDSKNNTKTIADTEAAIADLTAQHGKSQVAILAGSGTIVDNTTELLKSSLAHRDLKQDVQQLNDKQADGKISGEDYTLAMDHLNVKILEQEDAHKKLVETQGTGLTALQLAGTEQGNYTTKLGEMNTKLQEAKDKDIALQTQIATRIKEGLVLRDLEDAAENGLTEAEILRIKTTAEALGVADSEAIAGTLRVETAATGLADAREKYATAFDTSNAEGMAAFTAYADSIATDITNKMEPDLAKAGKAADSAAERVRFLARDYNGIQSKTVEVQINIRETTFRNSVELGQGYSAALAATAVPVPLAGDRAAGGPVMGSAGTYLVGEMGPELFNPAGNGMIIPNSMLGGMGGGGSLRIGTLNLYGVQSASELFNQLSKEARARGLQFAVN
jgi:tape measure domain-containing protein